MTIEDAASEAGAGTGASAYRPRPQPQQFAGLLGTLYADPVMTGIFSEDATIEGWLRAEAALALAQAEAGVLPAETAAAIAAAAALENVDRARLWDEARNVGYPILPLVRMVAGAAPDGANGRVHYGATTQDIMDTGLALQLSDALHRLEALLCALGDEAARIVDAHRHTVMAARTHAQQAVPTTLGAKFAVLLDEIARHLERIGQARPRTCVVSLYGAGGTSAAFGPQAAEVRERMAERLGLGVRHVPWHVARDGLAEFGLLCASLSATCARLGRDVIDLSRTEIGELREADGHHRGASSTMPQKENPISSEALVGMAATAGALASAVFRAMEAGHERAAGEWQAEWHVLPQLAVLAASSLRVGGEVVAGLRVYPGAMRDNLNADSGLVMAEAYMMMLAPDLGRERAHDLVYAASQLARASAVPLRTALKQTLPADLRAMVEGRLDLAPDDYLGSTDHVCDAALANWRNRAGGPGGR